MPSKDYYYKNLNSCRKESRDRRNWIKNNDSDKWKEIQEKQKIYREKNREEILARRRNCKKLNKEKLKEQRRTYNQKPATKELNRRRKRHKLKTDPRFALDERMSRQFWNALKSNKNSKSWKFIIGYSLDDLFNEINKKLRNTMTWQDFLDSKIEIDHIIPKSHFNYLDQNDEEFKLCWSLENLQPLWNFENLSKSNKLIVGNQDIPEESLRPEMFENEGLKQVLRRALEKS